MQPIERNRDSRRRLVAAVGALAEQPPADPSAVAAALAQLAFWDRWAEQLLRRWRSGQLPPPSVPQWYDDAINSALADQWAALDPGTAGRRALAAAGAVDHEVEQLESPVLAAITAADELDLVRRYAYREPVLTALDAPA